MIEQSNSGEVREKNTTPSTDNFDNKMDKLMKELTANGKVMLSTFWSKEEEL